MTVTASVSIDRSGMAGSPAALAISGDGSGAYSLMEGGLGRALYVPRYNYADQSVNLGGQLLTQAVKDLGGIPLEVIVQGTSVASLNTALADLEDALWQFAYSTTVTIGGAATTYACQPTIPRNVDGAVVSSYVEDFFEVVSFTIPVQPLGA